MIRSFKDAETERLFGGFRSKRLPQEIQRTAYRKLKMLDQARELRDLSVFPANHLEKLKGDRSGQYSIRINDQWRICFEWTDGDVNQVEIVDYH